MADEKEYVELPITWEFPDDSPVAYVNNIIVQHTEHEFIVSFFQTLPPVLLGSPEQQQEQAERIGPIKARCVARVMVPPTRMSAFIDTLQQNYERYQRAVEVEKSEGEKQPL